MCVCVCVCVCVCCVCVCALGSTNAENVLLFISDIGMLPVKE